jgi:glucose-1-phosphatase
MKSLKNTIPGYSKIKNIIFDFGGVICDLDISRTELKFREFGPAKVEETAVGETSSLRFDKLVEQYEKGLVSSQEFRNIIKNHYQKPLSDSSIDDAWNALLVGIPQERIILLKEIKDNYRIFLLSNSNEIHYHHYLEDFRKKSGYGEFDDLFEKSYFSFQIHLSKPGKEVFSFVLHESRLDPSETLFIDDTLKHVETARLTGINACHLDITARENLADLFI